MDARSKVFVGAFLLVVAAAAAYNYYTYFVKQDYIVLDYVSCDLTLGPCFIYECEEGSEDCDDSPYQKIEKSARTIAACSRDEEYCPELSCEDGEEGCMIISCTAESLEDGEICFIEENLEESVEVDGEAEEAEVELDGAPDTQT